mgnify:FL=1
MMRKTILSICAVLLIAGCANTQPRFDTSGVATGVTPQGVAADTIAQAPEVLWGGVIVNSSNLTDATQLEVLAYPLDDRQRPNTALSPIGRFLAVAPGYLETADYTQGRLITIRGRLQDRAEGRIGEARYAYPVIEILDSQLWQREDHSRSYSQPRVNFGIGVMIGR